MSDTLCVHTSSVGRTHIATCATCAVLCNSCIELSFFPPILTEYSTILTVQYSTVPVQWSLAMCNRMSVEFGPIWYNLVQFGVVCPVHADELIPVRAEHTLT